MIFCQECGRHIVTCHCGHIVCLGYVHAGNMAINPHYCYDDLELVAEPGDS